jgi:hypothetical protein
MKAAPAVDPFAPKTKMKPFYWTKIADRAAESTVWVKKILPLEVWISLYDF